jgi:ring-1,2-phenylacetyl-CoA epoxidase subunit PaaE
MSGDRVYPLTVLNLDRQTEDAVTITLGVPAGLREDFRYLPGQYLMVRFTGADGEEEFRSYSICQAPPADGSAPASVRIAVKLLGPGGFAELAHVKLGAGDTVEVLPPAGRFRLKPAPRHVAVAAGSGITPVLAMAQAGLARGDEFALVYGNRTRSSAMFSSELADLETRFAGRFTVVHVLSRETSSAALPAGRIGAGNLAALLGAAGCSTADEELQYYLCGPGGLVTTIRSFLLDAGVERRRIHAELFAVPVSR